MNFAQKFDHKLNIFQSVVLSLLTKIGPFFVALMPSCFTAYSVYFVFEQKAGEYIAVLFSLIVAIAIEAVAIVVTHTALDLYNAYREQQIELLKVVLMCFLIPFYVIAVAAAVYFSGDAFDPLVKSLGMASPLLTCIVYLSVALAQDVLRVKNKVAQEQGEQKESKKEQAAFARELRRQQLQQEHEQRLKMLELQAQVELAKVQSTMQQESKEEQEIEQAPICPFCSSEQKSKKALNAHLGHCKMRAKTEQSVNGAAH